MEAKVKFDEILVEMKVKNVNVSFMYKGEAVVLYETKAPLEITDVMSIHGLDGYVRIIGRI